MAWRGGSCRVGADAVNSVVSANGETHDIRGLYITGVSLFLASIIVNPQLTADDLASFITDQIIDGLTT
ncbi:MAG: GMC oxidoreductase [Paraperlucidibaca sp.]